MVVRDQNGKINGEYSYVLMHEQGSTTIDEEAKTFSSWKTNWKYTFDNLYSNGYLPSTVKELVEGEMAPVEVTLEDSLDGKAGMTTGVIHTNYSLDSVHMLITDSQGNVMYDNSMWPTVSTRGESNSNDYQIRQVLKEYDLAGFATSLREVMFQRGETYSYTITANLATDDSVVVKEGSFVNGQA